MASRISKVGGLGDPAKPAIWNAYGEGIYRLTFSLDLHECSDRQSGEEGFCRL
jgi:hypothetical protein